MKEHQLLLQKSASRRTLVHDGKIITAKSDVRWCMDIFGVLTWNGTHVWVAFVLDCHDRQIINHFSSTIGIDGLNIRDMLLAAVEQRFGKAEYPHTIQLLSDNGPQFTSRETVHFASSIGFQVCTTPAYSPESNGMAEAFVKTFKRDKDVAMEISVLIVHRVKSFYAQGILDAFSASTSAGNSGA